MIHRLHHSLLLPLLLVLAACGGSGEDNAATAPPPTQPAAGAPGTVQLDAASYTVGQASGSLAVNVKRTDGSSGAISVSYATTAGTAIAGTDYTAAVGTLSWSDGDSAAKPITIPIATTPAFSGTRALSVGLTAVTGGATLGALNSAPITITGSAAPPSAGTLSLSAATYAVAQNAGSLTVAVNRASGSAGAVSLTYATQNGTAVAGTDYTSTTGTLTWAAGDAAAKTFAVPVSNTVPFTGSKTFTIKISGASGGATLGSIATSTATITGSGAAAAAGSLTLSASAYTVAQATGTLSVSVARSGGSAGAIAVTYATANGTAVAGTDYTTKTGTLTWAAGDTAAKSFTVAISTATPFTGSKTFNIALSGATNGASLGSPGSATVTINGSPLAGTLKFAASTYAITQGTGALTLTVTRTGGANGAIAVNYASANGTGSAGTHYTATSGSLTWANADTTAKTITVPISATAFSGTKTFAVTLSGATGGATLSAPTTTTVTITGTGTPPAVPTGAMGDVAASRLLHQATFGATLDSIATASVQTYATWFAAQAALTPSLISPSVPNKDTDWYPFWLQNSIKGQDQLRQRTAFALSQILVVSDANGALQFHNEALAAYYDILTKGALGNFRDLIEKVTLSPAMGQYLSMFRNDKPNAATGVHADENYAREIMQLFTVGLVQLNADGTPKLDGGGNEIPAYGQAEVEALARVFTGWASKPTTNTFGEQSWQFDEDFINPMVAYENHHDTGAKTIIGGTNVPAGGTAAADLKIALDTLFNHPNVGPFIGKQLIQRLVTSNPSPAYVARITAVFNNNGAGVRGDLLAVVKAILTDAEAVNASTGKLREPLLRLTNLWRAFDAADGNNKFYEGDILRASTEFFAQAPLRSPSVFNFYRPDYVRAGPLTDAGLVGPEFQITNENTLVLTANKLQWQAYQYLDSAGRKHAGANYDYSANLDASSVLLHTAAWEAFAATPATLVDKLNLVLMSGAMSATMKATLIDYINAIPANEPWTRVAETADLLINSPQYAVQR